MKPSTKWTAGLPTRHHLKLVPRNPMAKRSKTDAGAGVPEGEGEGPGEAEGEPAIDDPSAFDDVPTRPGVVVDLPDSEETPAAGTDPGSDVGDFASMFEPGADPAAEEEFTPVRTRNDPVASGIQDDPDLVTDPDARIESPAGGAQILDFSSGRADAGAAADDEGVAPTDHAGADDSATGPGTTAEGDDPDGETERVPFELLEPLIEALLLASDRPLSVSDIKRLSGETDARLINQALEALIERRRGGGIQIMAVAGAYSLRTNPRFADWVSKLVSGKPVRLSRATLETLAIVAYRQPITRPEIDDIRGVDCGPVLRTLLDRNLVRIIGVKEEVGRPMLYGTTSEFLRIFSLKDLTQLPTLRQFHELSIEHQAKVDESHPAAVDATVGMIGGGAPIEALATPAISAEPGEDDRLISDLEEASEAASRAAGPLSPEPPPGEGDPESGQGDAPAPAGKPGRFGKPGKSAASD
jgi:segregation and condensation protein B